MKKVGIFLFVFCVGILHAWMTEDDVGTCGAQFLKIGIGAKPMGMSGAYSGFSDVSSLYWNPAGIASVEARQALIQHTQWFEDTSIEFLGAVFPGEKRVLGLSATYLKIDDFEKRVGDTTNPIGKFDAKDMAIGVSCARKGTSLNWGMTVKAIKSKIDNESSNLVIAGDFGILGKASVLGIPGRVALVLKDFGTKIKFESQKDPLPSVIKLGLGLDVDDGMLLGIDLNLPRDNKTNVNIGFEYQLPVTGVKLPLRIGWKSLNDFDTISGFSAGFGLGFSALDFDFAWVPYGDFSDTYRFSLTGRF